MNQVGLAIPSVILDSPDPNPDIWNLTDTFWENTFRKWDEINLITDINFQRLDLFEDETITLTQSIQDIRDIEKVFTDFSKSFSLPASATNNKLFKHYYRRDLISDAIPNGIFNANSKLDAILELNFKPFRRGYIVLNGVKLKNNVPDSYNITFYGQTVQLKDRLSDRKLSSLDFGKYNHEYNITRVKEGLQTFVSELKGQTVTVPHIIYPLISHTNRFIYDTGTAGTTLANTRNIDYTGNQSTDSEGFHYTDLKPALRIIDIIETLEQDKDINMRFTDDFFKTSGFFANLYMWLHRNKGDIGVTPSNETGVNLIIIDNISSFTGDVTDFFSDDSPSEFVPIFDGGAFRFHTANLYGGREREKMTIDWTVTPSVNTKKFTVRLRKFGTNETIAEIDHVSGNTSTQLRHTFQEPDYEAGGVVVEHNVELVIETEESVLALTYDLTFRKRIEEDGESDLRYDITAQSVSPGNVVDTLSVSDQIPDMKILTFLTGLFKTFNLTAFVEDDVSSADFAKVKVQTLDAFYESGTSRDITQYIKQDESESNFSVPFNDIEFKFEEPKTFGAFYYNKLNSREYGSVKARDAENSGRDPRLNRGQDYRITVPFEKMFFERIKDSNDDTDTQVGYGFFVDDNQSPAIGKPLFFFKNTTPTGTKSVQMYDGGGTGTPAEITSYNRPTNFQQGTSSVSISVDTDEPNPVTFSYLDASYVSQTIVVQDGGSGNISEAITNSVRAITDVQDTANISIDYTQITASQTINFSQEIDPFIPVIDTNTLFQTFYSTYISDIFDYNRRLVKVKAILPQSFLLNYKLSDTIIINNEEFVINKIDTNLQTGESSLELLNKVKRV